MNIEQALKLRKGDSVIQNPGRGGTPYRATVTRINHNPIICRTLFGVEFIWLEIAKPGAPSTHVPSFTLSEVES